MNLTVSLAQFRVTLSDPAENLRRAEVMIADAARGGSQMICFPEMWTTGFQWAENDRLFATHEAVIDAVAALAAKYRIWINGSMSAAAPDGRMANTSILFDDTGRRAGTYSKTHLFTPIHEEQHMVAGNALTLVETPWGRAALAICYDLRFPELFRTYALRGADFVLHPAAVPHPRLPHWQVLTRARAIENQMFFLAINQVGSENWNSDPVTYFGSSAVIDPLGNVLIEGNETDEALLTVTIDTALTAATREQRPVLKDRRPELYELG